MEREGPDGLLTVGLVARRSGLTAKARRHYDRVGLLRPTVVDRTTGYRLYRSEQIAEAWLGCVLSILAVASGRRRDGSQGGGGAHSGAIRDDGNAARRPSGGRAADPRSAGHALVHLLRSLDLPLDQVRTAVAGWKGGDTEAVSDVIREHRRHLDARVVRLRGALHRIDHLLVEGTRGCHARS